MQLYQNISNALKGQDKSEFEGQGLADTRSILGLAAKLRFWAMLFWI